MPATEAQRDWVRDVLGFTLPSASVNTDFPPAWRKAVAGWRDASDTVDTQITALQSALKGSGDSELEEIGEYGLNGVTGGFKVPLMAALQELDPASPQPRVFARAKTVVAGFRRHLNQDERVLGCDENPFGVRVTLRETLGGALDQLDTAMQLAD